MLEIFERLWRSLGRDALDSLIKHVESLSIVQQPQQSSAVPAESRQDTACTATVIPLTHAAQRGRSGSGSSSSSLRRSSYHKGCDIPESGTFNEYTTVNPSADWIVCTDNNSLTGSQGMPPRHHQRIAPSLAQSAEPSSSRVSNIAPRPPADHNNAVECSGDLTGPVCCCEPSSANSSFLGGVSGAEAPGGSCWSSRSSIPARFSTHFPKEVPLAFDLSPPIITSLPRSAASQSPEGSIPVTRIQRPQPADQNTNHVDGGVDGYGNESDYRKSECASSHHLLPRNHPTNHLVNDGQSSKTVRNGLKAPIIVGDKVQTDMSGACHAFLSFSAASEPELDANSVGSSWDIGGYRSFKDLSRVCSTKAAKLCGHKASSIVKHQRQRRSPRSTTQSRCFASSFRAHALTTRRRAVPPKLPPHPLTRKGSVSCDSNPFAAFPQEPVPVSAVWHRQTIRQAEVAGSAFALGFSTSEARKAAQPTTMLPAVKGTPPIVTPAGPMDSSVKPPALLAGPQTSSCPRTPGLSSTAQVLPTKAKAPPVTLPANFMQEPPSTVCESHRIAKTQCYHHPTATMGSLHEPSRPHGLLFSVWNRSKTLRKMALYIFLVLVYSVVHSFSHLIRVLLLNIAINSSDSVMFLIVTTNNFAEVKSTVFKKFNDVTLFGIFASDAVERFYLFCDGLLVFLRISSAAMYMWGPSLWSIMWWLVWMIILELVVDWFKHGFLLKLNFIHSQVFTDYFTVLCADILVSRSKRRDDVHSSKHHVEIKSNGPLYNDLQTNSRSETSQRAPKIPLPSDIDQEERTKSNEVAEFAKWSTPCRGHYSFSHTCSRRIGFIALPIAAQLCCCVTTFPWSTSLIPVALTFFTAWFCLLILKTILSIFLVYLGLKYCDTTRVAIARNPKLCELAPI